MLSDEIESTESLKKKIEENLEKLKRNKELYTLAEELQAIEAKLEIIKKEHELKKQKQLAEQREKLKKINEEIDIANARGKLGSSKIRATNGEHTSGIGIRCSTAQTIRKVSDEEEFADYSEDIKLKSEDLC